MMRNSRNKAILALAGVAGTALGLLPVRSARADERFWYFADSTVFEPYFNGAFAAPAYWHGLSIPAPGDVIRFSQGLTAPGFPAPSAENPFGTVPSTVYFGDFNHHSFLGDSHTHYDAVNAVVNQAYIHNGSFEFNFGSGVGGWAPHNPGPSQGSLRIDQSISVADQPYQSAELRVREGWLQNNGVAHVAKVPGSTGTVDVSGPSARWDIGAWMDLGWVGSGTLRISDNAQVTVGYEVKAGIRDGSSGHVIVSDGGKLTIGKELSLGNGSESSGATYGTLNLSGVGSSVAATNLFIGGTGSATAVVSNGATLSAADVIRLGSLASGNSLEVFSGATANARRLFIGTQAHSVNNEMGISGHATSVTIADEALIGAAGASGHLSVSGGADFYAGDIGVGEYGDYSSGLLSASGSGTTVRSGYTLTIGAGLSGAGASQGAVSVSSGASIVADNAINVGFTSIGSLSLSSGGTARSEFGRIARLGGSTGSAIVSGVGSRWDVGSSMFVGGHTSSGLGGTGSLVVSSGGAVTAGQSLGTWRDGTVDVSTGGRVQIGAGDIATVPSGAIRIGTGGTLFGDGTILGDVILSGGTISPGHSPGILNLDGNLSLGSQGSLFMEIGGTARDRYDGLFIAGAESIELGGTMVLSFVDGFGPREGDVFDLFVMSMDAAVTGHFSAIDVQNLAPGWEYRMAIDPTTHRLQVTSLNDGVFVPGPGVGVLLGLGCVMHAGSRRRRMG